MKKIYSLLLAIVVCTFTCAARIVTTSPAILQETSKNVLLTYHADASEGNNGLKGLTASNPIYAHIGVLTDKSANTSDWRYCNFTWPTSATDAKANTDKNRLTYKSANTWELTLGDMRTYFGISDPNEHILKIAIVFRTADGSKEGKTASGGDIFIDVQESGFRMQFAADPSASVISAPATINLTVDATQSATLTISVNGKELTSVNGATTATTKYSISSTGSYAFTATATAAGQTLSQTINIAYPGASTAGTYPGGVPKMGAVKNADGTVTFCIAAPGKKSAILVPSWDDYAVLDKNIMKYQDYNGQRYFFTTVSGLKDNQYYPYYYIIDATYKVADPYARLVLDCYSDKWLDDTIWPDMPQYPYEKFDDTMLAVYHGDMESDFTFAKFNIPDHSNLVIYEMLIRDFTGTEGQANGEGTLKSAMTKLDYLQNLGINAIELMPVMEFNGNNSWGYNTNFYFALDKAYGSPRDMKTFVNECHKRGIAVILDIVFNQSDGLHPWYQMYPIESNPFYNKTAPHAYSVLNDWKQENTLVQQQWNDVLQYWLSVYNVDGFRFDLVKGLGTSYSNGDTESYNASRVATMKRLHAAIKAVKPNGIHINENLAQPAEENEMAADGQLNWANVNEASCQYTMGYGTKSNTARFSATNDSRTWGSTVAYAESHDEERMGFKQTEYGASQVKNSKTVATNRLAQLAVQMLMMPGPKMIWQFGELGADQTTKNGNDNNTDPKKVIWSYLEDTDRANLHATYRALCRFRQDNPTLFSNSATLTLTGFADNITSNRIIRLTNGDTELIAFINPALAGAVKSVGTTSTKLNSNNCQLICATPGYNGTISGSGTSVAATRVPANGFAVFATKNTLDVDNITIDSTDAVNVYGEQGRIVIEGNYDNAQVYNMAGNAQPGLEVPAGFYIVVVDGNSHKVTVH